MANGFDPKTFNFQEQTARSNLKASLGNAYPSWSAYQSATGHTPWQMGWDVDDMKLATSRGASPYGQHQLEIEARKRGLRIGPNATIKLNKLRTDQPEAFKAPIDYGALGGYGFDASDIGAMWGTGPADDEGVAYGLTSPEWNDALQNVRDAWVWAQDQNLPNSSSVDTWIQNKENEQRDAKNKEFFAAQDQKRLEAETQYQNELLAQQQAAAAEQVRIQEAANAQAARVKGSSPTGVGSAASIKGSRLTITEGKGRKGTKQFSRPTEYLNTLGIGGGGATSRSSTVTL